MSNLACPVSGSTTFEDDRNIPKTRCRPCTSNERTGVINLFPDRYAKPQPGQRVLHGAPEISLGKHITGIDGGGYEAVDFARNLGAVCDLTETCSLTDVFFGAELTRANIREGQWTCSGSSRFYLRRRCCKAAPATDVVLPRGPK